MFRGLLLINARRPWPKEAFSRSLILVAAWAAAASATSAQAAITFEDVSSDAGIAGKGTTFGASWGDFDGDGWPDVWVSNHNAKPSLYLNKRDGTFADVVDAVWSADPAADTHGAAWGDFDNDGDQDLIEMVDVVVGENMCLGCGPNHFFVNADGVLTERAGAQGLHEPMTQARTPLWLDANRDGRLDVLVTGREARDAEAAVLYEQQDGRFAMSNGKYRIGRHTPGLLERAKGYLPWSTDRPPSLRLNPNIAFAQLVDIDGDDRAELATFGPQTHVYSIGAVPFVDITDGLGLPEQSDVSDIVIADFDGDLEPDMFLLHGRLPYNLSQVATIDEGLISGTISGHRASVDNSRAEGIRFRARGSVRFVLEPEWFSVRNIAIGRDGLMPASRVFTLSPEDPGAAGMPPEGRRGAGTLAIGYDASTGYWAMRNATPAALVDFAISAEGIEGFEYLNWEGFAESGGQRLYLQRNGAFVPQVTLPADKPHLSCHSVVAEDFDNDRDLDLYLVCAAPAGNLANRLYENDGRGNFSLVPAAGGAAGATAGRGDAVVSADYDRDGYVDLFVTNGFDPTSPFVEDGPHQLFRNQGAGNHWLEIDLTGTVSNRDAIGAVVVVEADGVRQRRVRGGGMHLHAQNHARLHFGLGSNDIAEFVVVHWPSGIEQRLERVAADQILSLVEPGDAR